MYNHNDDVMTYFQDGFRICGFVLLTVVVNWQLVFAVLPCSILLYVVRCVYMNSQRDTIRLIKISNSPFLGHVSATIDGADVIRAFGTQERCYSDMAQHWDTKMGCQYANLCNFVWFHLNMNLVTSLLNILVAAICILGAESESIL